jgi:hypothetical protein
MRPGAGGLGRSDSGVDASDATGEIAAQQARKDAGPIAWTRLDRSVALEMFLAPHISSVRLLPQRGLAG